MGGLALCADLADDLLRKRRACVFRSNCDPHGQRTVAIDVIEVQYTTARRGELNQFGSQILREAPPMLVRYDACLHAANGIREHRLGHAEMPTDEFDSVHQ